MIEEKNLFWNLYFIQFIKKRQEIIEDDKIMWGAKAFTGMPRNIDNTVNQYFIIDRQYWLIRFIIKIIKITLFYFTEITLRI